MNFRVTAAMLAVLIVLAGVVYYVQQSPAPKQGASLAQNPTVLTFSPTDATNVVISSGDKTTELTKAGATWNLVKPVATPADASRVEGWVDQLGNLTADRSLDNVADLSTYGLVKPKLNVEVGLTGGKSVKLAFGDKTPDGTDYYVQVPGDPSKAKSVYLISAPLGDDLTSALATPPKAVPTPTALPTLAPAPTLNVPPPAATPTAAAAGQ